ncbi:SDR family NAD(P)-dependent oxidoreductase [Streptomyces mirabilis]|uniref:SDR family NAD(P)-dependent oxidoreductase n=1 Tax=Streptomyces TaxID=1883 RepID=UPI000BCE410D|nr:SDR family NAD(P)-dependent oxidoreductase [Streptomyces sp. OV198]SOE77984.1 NAD(P)-dependent dehydrogenase, short-chain alcohol dehydrogenase family [Streptomyces sp. OV198]
MAIMGRLAGKIAFISGTGAGIGRAAAQVFAAEGATVFGCDLDADAAAETVELVEKAGGVMRSLAPVDLSSEAGAHEWIDAGIEALGGIDILYNNASALRNGPFATMPAEDWYFTIKNELDIPYFCTQAAWPHLIARGGGAVLNVASVAAVRGAPFMPMVPHGAAKGGVLAMSKHLCAAGAPHHIRVNTIAPGMTRTSATAPFLDDPDGPKAQLEARIPVGRVGEPEDIARAAAFLCSDEAAFVNGANLMVDGGDSAMAG